MLGAFIAAVTVVAAIGAQFSPARDPDWYAALAKPWFNPPGWVFAPVWTTLYGMIAVAGWLTWRAVGRRVTARPLALWALQLVLNGLWTPIFFGLQRIDLALAEILILLAAIIACDLAFFRVARPAGWLLVPYALWVTFAALLTAAIWKLNP